MLSPRRRAPPPPRRRRGAAERSESAAGDAAPPSSPRVAASAPATRRRASPLPRRRPSPPAAAMVAGFLRGGGGGGGGVGGCGREAAGGLAGAAGATAEGAAAGPVGAGGDAGGPDGERRDQLNPRWRPPVDSNDLEDLTGIPPPPPALPSSSPFFPPPVPISQHSLDPPPQPLSPSARPSPPHYMLHTPACLTLPTLNHHHNHQHSIPTSTVAADGAAAGGGRGRAGCCRGGTLKTSPSTSFDQPCPASATCSTSPAVVGARTACCWRALLSAPRLARRPALGATAVDGRLEAPCPVQEQVPPGLQGLIPASSCAAPQGDIGRPWITALFGCAGGCCTCWCCLRRTPCRMMIESYLCLLQNLQQNS